MDDAGQGFSFVIPRLYDRPRLYRRSQNAWLLVSLRPLDPGHPGVVAFARIPPPAHGGEKAFVVAVNLRPEPAALWLPEAPMDFRRGLVSAGGGIGTVLSLGGELTLGPWAWIIFERWSIVS
ncbi:MAG: hypothetical protein ABIK09_02055 [Pseudomonadota bacterium]